MENILSRVYAAYPEAIELSDGADITLLLPAGIEVVLEEFDQWHGDTEHSIHMGYYWSYSYPDKEKVIEVTKFDVSQLPMDNPIVKLLDLSYIRLILRVEGNDDSFNFPYAGVLIGGTKHGKWSCMVPILEEEL
jgi:hypothetical protein